MSMHRVNALLSLIMNTQALDLQPYTTQHTATSFTYTNTYSVGWLPVLSSPMSLDPDLRCLHITSTITISRAMAKIPATTQPAAATATTLTTTPALAVCVCAWVEV